MSAAPAIDAVIIGPAHPYRGGIADTNEAMARAFQVAGKQCAIVTFTLQYPSVLFPGKTQFSSDPKPDSLRIVRLINSLNPITWWRTARWINKHQPEVVVIRYWLPFLGPCFGFIASLIAKRTKVVGLCDNVIPHEHRAMDQRFTSYFMSKCDAFMALSKAVKSDLDTLSDKPNTYFPHPINDQLGPLVPKAKARERLGLDAAGKYILFFGFVRHYKGLDLLLRAMAESSIPADVKLIIAGEFYDDPATYHQLIDQLKLNDRVVLRNDFIPSEEVPNYFCAADLVTQTYRTATQSGITQMALHFEVPALVTRVGGLDEFVDEGKTGLFASTEPASIAASIAQFFQSDASEMQRHIQAAKKSYAWSSFVDHFYKFVATLKA